MTALDCTLEDSVACMEDMVIVPFAVVLEVWRFRNWLKNMLVAVFRRRWLVGNLNK